MTIFHDTRAKGRAPSVDENGASLGIVLNMDMVPTSYYGMAYTIPVQVGSSLQNLSLQVDTGSSDLWIASKSCPSASCSATNGHLYDPSSSQSTGATFTMQYLAGTVTGPIVWDRVQIGGYTISNQALAAATTVNNEPLSYNFDGVLGLALPSNSVIQQSIPASTGDAPDGATVSSNLLSLAPATNAPSQPFFSLTLARPGFNQTPSLLGIGRHPSEIVPDPSQIRYSSIVGDSVGMLFWKTTVRAITVYINGQAYPIALQSLSGASEPTALLDSGVPLIITTPALANGIYGALGIGPAADGNYYVPCATPLNMTITLDGQNELPLHPLDLTMEPAGQADSEYCTGVIQTDVSRLTATSDIGDMILGVPFMRNVYTVMAYEQPDDAGRFNTSVAFGTNPTLGLLGLTNATQAMAEFDQVRVSKGSGAAKQSATEGGGLQRSIGVDILIGLVGFVMLCLALFAVRWVVVRRRAWSATPLERDDGPSDRKSGYGMYSRSSADQDTLLYDASLHTHKPSHHTMDSAQTRVEDAEFGMWRRSSKLPSNSPTDSVDTAWHAPWDTRPTTWCDTLVGTEAGDTALFRSFPPGDLDRGLDSPHESLPELTSASLMAWHDQTDFQSDPAHVVGMAGVGTAARGSVIDASLQLGRPSYESVRSLHTLGSPMLLDAHDSAERTR